MSPEEWEADYWNKVDEEIRQKQYEIADKEDMAKLDRKYSDDK